MFGNKILYGWVLLSIFISTISNVYCIEPIDLPRNDNDRYLTTFVRPQELLKIYADEKEKSGYYYAQKVKFWNQTGSEYTWVKQIPREYLGAAVYWSDYSIMNNDDALYYTDKMIEDKVNGAPDAVKNSFKNQLLYEREKKQKEAQKDKENDYNGKYKSLGGPSYLWKILDREKELNSQGITFAYFGKWPVYYQEVSDIEWEIPELSKLKLVAFMLLANYHIEDKNVCDELIRRYQEYKPTTYKEWVIKEQMRNILRMKVNVDNTLKLKVIPDNSINYSDEYLAWKLNEDSKNIKSDKYLTEYVPPQELLKIYADEKEKPLYFEKQSQFVNEDNDRKLRFDAIPDYLKRHLLYWREYRECNKDDIFYYNDSMIDSLIKSVPEDKQKSFKIALDKMIILRKRLEVEDHEKSYGGLYKNVVGPTYLWKILDRKKELNGEQHIKLLYCHEWPEENEIDEIQQKTSELLKLKLIAFLFLTGHINEGNGIVELIHRYNEFKPATYEEWVVKEQMRALLRETSISYKIVPEILAVPIYPINRTKEYIEWKKNNDKNNKEKLNVEKDKIEIKKN
jgi:hypothetical protein